MKVFLYIVLGLLVLTGAFFAWFFLFFLKTPELSIPDGANAEERIAHIDTWLTELQQAHKFNGAVLLAKDGKKLLAKGYGYSDHKLETPLTEHSSFRLASVSKQFTAVGIMLLKDKGLLAFDDPVVSIISDFPYPEVCIRHLLNQSSGVPDIYMELAERQKETIPLLSNELATQLVVQEQREAVFAPNEKFQYSNTNYILLARIIEIISGKSFEDFMRQEVFEPLGMSHTRIWNLLSEDSTFTGKTADFQNFNGLTKELSPSFIDGVAGDGAVFSSVSDMLRWDQFWYGNDLLSEETLQEAWVQPQLSTGKNSDYGFGWVITQDGMWHNGAWLGANTLIVRNTDTRTCMVLLDNSSNLFFDQISEELRRVFKQGL